MVRTLDLETLKKMERHMVRGQLYTHFDLERKNAKQAEARLDQRLQRLEYICLYRMKLLTWEQKQLQKELQKLRQETMKKHFSSYLGNGIQKRPEDVLMFSPQGRQKHRLPQAKKMRASATSMTQDTYKSKSQVPPSRDAGLKDPMRSKEQPLFQNNRTTCFIKEHPQAQEKDSVNPPKDVDSSKGICVLCQDQAVSTNTTEQGPSSSPASDSGMERADETRSKDVALKPDGNTGKQMPLNHVECAGSFQGESPKPTFLELLSKARNAHYLRHRVPPESERLLSIGEIFGHGESSLSSAGEECENRTPSKFLPL
ncbi:coiled-coil domain-containing protein 190 isoform X2 [Saimiri boliviensis]|uniref:coiled-coil domain-containing protein 190 isoform X2 n=1 Tax=Saimiri boliviensis TaxID=27679 RepID=UPI00193C8A07|nr:coiled-coil domain-containing protein 190 isoform X2 [Saimiri boliviensis boliviensis]